jgi:3-hydroxybutyryl-CoA dehydrogenase
VMKLVEVVTTELTAPDVDETVRALCAKVGKVAVSCGDRAGFIVNALLFPYLNDAVTLVESGAHDLVAVDTAIKEHVGFPMGPFELLDVVGNDVSLAIQKELYAEFKEPGFAPAPLLERVVAEGRLGRKTKRGFHDYS